MMNSTRRRTRGLQIGSTLNPRQGRPGAGGLSARRSVSYFSCVVRAAPGIEAIRLRVYS
jgi:hypothetical protein